MQKQELVRLKSRSHITYRLFYHLILSIKYRHDVLTDEMQKKLQMHLTGLLDKWECELVEYGAEPDHVHLLIDAHPNLNLSSLIKNLKSVSSRHMRKEYGDALQKKLWGGELWSDGSTIISVGSRAALEALIPYIKNQGKAEKIDDA